MIRRFASIKNPESIGYLYDTDNWMAQDRSPIDSNFQVYSTYGDGLIQHRHASPIQVSMFGDYMASLAVAMLEDEELCKDLVYMFSRRPSDEDLRFAASVIFKAATDATSYEKKDRYVSMSERKISSNPEKRHDKRYERVSSFHNGTPEAIFTLVLPQYCSGLIRYQYAEAVRDYCESNGWRWMPPPARFLRWTDDSEEEQEMVTGYLAALSVVEAYRYKSLAERHIANAKRRAERPSVAA